MRKHPDTNYVEMDTVLGKQGKGKRMLTMLFVQQNLMLIFLMRDGKGQFCGGAFRLVDQHVGH